MSCLRSLAAQSELPDEVVIAYQGTDEESPKTVKAIAGELPMPIVEVYVAKPGIVAAENAALRASNCDIVVLLDDDAIAPPQFIERHRTYYQDPTVGAAGGCVYNFYPNGNPYPCRETQDLGKITFFGRIIGHLHDHPKTWQERQTTEVDHTAGGNMSIRRVAFSKFEDRLRPYWHFFETDACLQVKQRGYKIIFDFANTVNHFPSITEYDRYNKQTAVRHVYNVAYNRGLIHSKFSSLPLLAARMIYWMLIGSRNEPGLLAMLVNAATTRRLVSELRICSKVLPSYVTGVLAGVQHED